MNIFKYGLTAVLAIGLASCGGGTPPSLTIGGPAALTAGAAKATFTATATPSSTSGTIQWTLNPPTGSGTLSASTSTLAGGVASVDYTPPASVSSTLPVTLTGTLQGGTLTGSKTFNVTSATASGVTVSGTVYKWSGKAEGGVNITIVGADKAICKDPVSGASPVSDPDGKFTCANVITPYQITAVPVIGSGEIPESYDNVKISNPVLVVRKNAFAASTPPGFDNECTPVPPNGKLKVILSQPVGVGNTGTVVFIAPGINYVPTQSNKSLTLGAGQDTFNLSVPFDKDMCYDDLTGTVVYIERTAGNTIIAKGARSDIRVFPNQETALDGTATAFPKLEVTTSNSATMAGTATFPTGLISQQVTTYLRVDYTIPVGKLSKIAPLVNLGKRQAYYALSTKILSNTSTSTTWDLPTEVFSSAAKLTYRAGFIGFAAGTTKKTSAWSDIVLPDATSIPLNAPSISGTQQPSGELSLPPTSPFRAPNGNIIPDFIVASIQNTGCTEGNNFLNNYIPGFVGATSIWLGNTFDPTIQLPDTNEPARIAFNTAYQNFALNGLCVRDATQTTSSDTILDGRAVQRNFYTDAALEEPDVIRSAVWNINPTGFKYLN